MEVIIPSNKRTGIRIKDSIVQPGPLICAGSVYCVVRRRVGRIRRWMKPRSCLQGRSRLAQIWLQHQTPVSFIRHMETWCVCVLLIFGELWMSLHLVNSIWALKYFYGQKWGLCVYGAVFQVKGTTWAQACGLDVTGPVELDIKGCCARRSLWERKLWK